MTTLNNALMNINTSVWVGVVQKVWWITSDKYMQTGNIWGAVAVTTGNPFASLGMYQPIKDLAAAKTYDT